MPVHCTLYPIRNVVRDWTTDLPISGRWTAAHNNLLFLQVRKYKDSFPGKRSLKEQNSLWNFPLMTCLFQGDLHFTRACVMSLLAKMLVRIFMNMLIKWRSGLQAMFFCLLQLSRHYKSVFMHVSTMCVLMRVHQRKWRRIPDGGTGKELNCCSFPPLAGAFSASQLVNFSTVTWKLLPHISKRGICLNFANLNNLTCLTGLWKINVNFK